MGVLTVKLLKVTNLQDSDGFGKSDPYVKFDLEQDNFFLDKRFGKKESTHKGNTLTPEYNEVFEWEDLPSMNNMKLWIKIMDDDIGRDDQIGKACINLERMGLTASPKETSVVVDKKKTGMSLNPVKLCCNCSWAICCKRNAEIHLEISYRE